MAGVEDDSTMHVPETDPKTLRRAALGVVRRSIDTDDAKQLLAMLGLDGVPMRKARRGNHGWPASTTSAQRSAAPPAPAEPGPRQGVEWRNKAACRGHDTELWYALAGTDDEAEARAICHHCPVRTACGEWAYDHNLKEGMWAGYQLDDREEKEEFHTRYRRHDESTAAPKVKRPHQYNDRVCACGTTYATCSNHTQCIRCRLDLIPADDAANAIERMRAGGWGLRTIAARTDVSFTAIKRIAGGRESTRRDISDRLVAAAEKMAVPV